MLCSFFVVEGFGDDEAKIDAAEDEGEFVADAFTTPSDQDENNGKRSAEDVEKWCHGVASNLSFCYVTNLTVVRFGILVVTFRSVPTSLYYSTLLRVCQVYWAVSG